MYKVIKELDFCYGHRLLNCKGSKCAHPHGHNGIVEIEFSARVLDERGMVMDFSDIKQEMKKIVDDKLDHKMILHQNDPLVKVLQDMNEPVFLMQENPTAENIAKLIFDFALDRGLPVSLVRLWETPSSYAEYHLDGG